MRPSSARILLACNDLQLRSLLSELLATQQYEVIAVGGDCTHSTQHCVADWDAAIVDAGSVHGTVRWLRTFEGLARVPTIAIAAKTGAAGEPLWNSVDAVLHDPLDARKLMLVVRGLLASRAHAARTTQTLTAGPVTLDSLLNTATVATREIALTDAETRVLRELMLTASTAVPRDRLMRSGVGRGWSPADRALDTHIKRLRRKIGADRQGKTPVRTVRGIGYLLLADWQPPT